MIFVSAHPFAVGLVETGRAYGIDEFLLVQWLAPLASEAPEFIVALLFVWRGQAAAGMRTLVSSKVNQWTLLIGTLPVVFSFGAGHLTGMPLNERQQHELWLTAAQSLFAVVLISEFAMERWEALALLVPFVAQLLLPPLHRRRRHPDGVHGRLHGRRDPPPLGSTPPPRHTQLAAIHPRKRGGHAGRPRGDGRAGLTHGREHRPQATWQRVEGPPQPLPATTCADLPTCAPSH